VAVGAKTRFAARAATWPLTPALIAGTLWADQRQPGPLFADASDVVSVFVYMVAMSACFGVGVTLTGRVFHQPAGWAFLGLATAFAWSSFTEEYAVLALGPTGADYPGAELVATLADSNWIWWFVFLALCLQLTAAIGHSPAHWRVLPRVTLGVGLVAQARALLRSEPLNEWPELSSPWAVGSMPPTVEVLTTAATFALVPCVLASVWVLVMAFRRARGEGRQQLLWLVAGATPIAPCVAASFALSLTDNDAAAAVPPLLAVIALALGAGFSVLKYRLYDVERVVSESVSYALASGSVIVVFGLVVVVITRTIPTLSSTARWPTSVATLAAASIARPAYLWARNAVDRKFNRRRFDAVQTVRSGLHQAGVDIENLLRDALGDPRARVVFPGQAGGWVTSSGHAAELPGRTVDVARDRGVTARIEFDPDLTEDTVVEAVGHEAAAEIDNLGLRAELARQVEEVTESRARHAGAHIEERQRIERDLHDGAQQRILAIALQLRSARVNGAGDALRDEVDRAIVELGLTVQELRDLANGLQPAALAGGGLRAAIEDLANRIPLRLDVDVVDTRFQPNLESAAWFVVAEAVANAVKHARAEQVTISVARDDGHLSVSATDDGVGGANPQGSGLQGLADRVAALGGSMRVHDQAPHGTRVEARFPCP
jgi:signal transduction histidine kinase